MQHERKYNKKSRTGNGQENNWKQQKLKIMHFKERASHLKACQRNPSELGPETKWG